MGYLLLHLFPDGLGVFPSLILYCPGCCLKPQLPEALLEALPVSSHLGAGVQAEATLLGLSTLQVTIKAHRAQELAPAAASSTAGLFAAALLGWLLVAHSCCSCMRLQHAGMCAP